ncbi:major royal jelly protein [Periconia macrospinosa]|uniref:Major royal jelly protein n=1 Tax=Periconia macrospinosa TaxID=97972 RepID=A0A2V1DEB2_9PLEO|nr:major royal jelly protein [Periconia macrospinosa]
MHSGLRCGLSEAQELLADTGVAGPPLEVVHYYYGQWPTGVGVSKTGRIFTTFPPGFDPNSTFDGSNGRFSVGELKSKDSEVAWPNVELNSPPGGAINYTTNPPTGANYPNYIIAAQSVVIDGLDRAWILDTGRSLTPNGSLVPASVPGGPKLIGIDLSKNDTVFDTIVFSPDVVFPDSYLQDVRFDLRPHLTPSGKGVAYITDSSINTINGLLVVDLGTHEVWRRFDGPSVAPVDQQFNAYIWGTPLLFQPGPTSPTRYLPLGRRLSLSADGEELFFGVAESRMLWSVKTELLRRRDAGSELAAQAGLTTRGQKGVSDGYEVDSNGLLYFGNVEQNAINVYHESNGTASVWVRDPRINWADTLAIAEDGYLYFTVNQLQLSPIIFPGTDRRVKPYGLLRAKLPGNGTKVNLI